MYHSYSSDHQNCGPNRSEKKCGPTPNPSKVAVRPPEDFIWRTTTNKKKRKFWGLTRGRTQTSRIGNRTRPFVRQGGGVCKCVYICVILSLISFQIWMEIHFYQQIFNKICGGLKWREKKTFSPPFPLPFATHIIFYFLFMHINKSKLNPFIC